MAEVNADFPGIVIWAFQTYGSQMNAVVASMLDRDLVVVATDFIANNGNQAELNQLAAQNLNATNLVRWQAAFTQAQVNPAVGAYSPSAVSTPYFAHPALKVAVNGGGMPPALPAPNPQTSMTIQEIYYEFRLAPYATPISAMGNALKYIAGKTGIWGAAYTGWQIGSWFYRTMVGIDSDYGYDLVTTYGSAADGFDFFPEGNTVGGGQGYYENGDGTYYDAYGNLLTSTSGGSDYGVAPTAPPSTAVPPLPPGATFSIPSGWPSPYTFWDPLGDCLLLLECGDEP